MRAILAVFLTEYLLSATGELAPMSENEANMWQHRFVAAVYFFPLLGAILSDWLLGKYRTILWLSLVYVAGHAVMAMVDFPQFTNIAPRTTLLLALAMIAIGSGGIKPCVSAHVGDQFGTQNQHLMAKVFGWFYFSINLGSTVSTLLTPWLLVKYGPGVAFGVPGILMALATLVFWLGRHRFVHIPPGRRQFFVETFSRQGLGAIGNLIPLYLLVAMFWCLFDQTQSAWVHQAKEMNRFVFGYELLPSQLQAMNPIMVMILIPVFSYIIYPLTERVFRTDSLAQDWHRPVRDGARFRDSRCRAAVDRRRPNAPYQLAVTGVRCDHRLRSDGVDYGFGILVHAGTTANEVPGHGRVLSVHHVGQLDRFRSQSLYRRTKGNRQFTFAGCQLLLVLHDGHAGHRGALCHLVAVLPRPRRSFRERQTRTSILDNVAAAHLTKKAVQAVI